MHSYVHTEVINQIGFITLDRPKSLNSLSLEMVRALSAILYEWRDNSTIKAVFICSSSEKAFCAGGDIRFFYDVGTQTPMGDSALLEDFFTEEYALNHLIHFYPKPYIALMNGVVMGGGMGIAQAGIAARLRIVTERTKMAMPEVNIGLFPDVGGSFFLNQTPGQIGTYLGVTGDVIGAADAIFANLADVYIPTVALPGLYDLLKETQADDVRAVIRNFAAQFATDNAAQTSQLARNKEAIDRHFHANTIHEILASLAASNTAFAESCITTMQKRSPLMMAVTLEQLRRCQGLTVAECLRIERTMVRHCFKHGEVLEGVRALVVDKDNQPQWSPNTVEEVNGAMVNTFFERVWPDYAHPLAALN
ncbi:enoyl-CoA hydratase/isomerase family protein [Undibacterium fentianense]|uniref:Enoyl-CoA hydratase/isomerase family protein n=1 Tax=Undibacterium fentianense TaxID=2828728 RepID=A0A941E4Y1_9BURK|nr:enoyl-CoA hydratase/isomerase family protein [Undibacterium fentianense]MBR7801636.1 enoyl-CoA hydratase/isomerase family protein [Undibacterium fentianense]